MKHGLPRLLISLGALLLVSSLLIKAISLPNTTVAAKPTPAPVVNDIKANAVMVTNREMNHGGTGLIYSSTKSKSWVLTNDHVCKVVKNGGMVLTGQGNFQVHSVIESKQSDLCFLSVLDNLNANTIISNTAPKRYDHVLVSGFPALMPNVVSEGHLSGRATISVFIGVTPCTEEDMKNDPFICAFIGGIPIIKNYESVLTSATIMPGNSGSGVYNSAQELVGVVFAGQGDLGYSWTVPYEQVVNFVDFETKELQEMYVDQVLHNSSKNDEEAKTTKRILEKCARLSQYTEITEEDSEKAKEVCSLISKDMIWRK